MKAEAENLKKKLLEQNTFDTPQLLTVVFSLPSSPDDVKILDQNCSTIMEVQDLFSSDKVSANSHLYKYMFFSSNRPKA